METMFTSLGSLALGLAAWAMPVAGLWRRRKGTWAGSALSWGCCAGALYLQVLYFGRLARTGDWSAVEDTAQAVVRVSTVLVAVTLLLNLALGLRSRGR